MHGHRRHGGHPPPPEYPVQSSREEDGMRYMSRTPSPVANYRGYNPGPFDRGRQPATSRTPVSNHGHYYRYPPDDGSPKVVRARSRSPPRSPSPSRFRFRSPPCSRSRSRSCSPSRRRSYLPTPYCEPALAPWARYTDDKYGDEWTRLANALRDYDEALIEDCKDDIDTLLVFAGLFSAVLTAFNVESYKNLVQDSGDTSAAALTQISQQLSSFNENSGTIESAPPSFSSPSFHPPSSAVRINALWFSSLVLSLVSASLGMLVKQWLREYRKNQYTSPQERIRIRHYRWEGLHRWRVFDIASLLPILLQIALILFFIGLSDFLRQLHPLVGWLVTSLVVLWLVLFAIGTLAPAVSYRCPYKVPFLNRITRFTRLSLSVLLRKGAGRISSPSSLFPGDERGIRRNRNLDIPAMIGADKLSGDDDFLEKTLGPCLQGADGPSVVRFVRGTLSNRLDREIRQLDHLQSHDLSHLTTKALYTSMSLIIDALGAELEQPDAELVPWVHEALVFLFCALSHAYVHDRPIGYAMDSGLEIQPKLLAQNKSLMREGLVLLVAYPRVPRVVFGSRVDQAITNRLISVAQDLVQEGSVDPGHLLRVMLSVTLMLPVQNIQSNRRVFSQLMSALAAAIQASPSSRFGYSIDTLSFCRELSDKLNARFRGLVPNELVRTLDTLCNPSTEPVVIGMPGPIPWTSEPKKFVSQMRPPIPIPPPVR